MRIVAVQTRTPRHAELCALHLVDLQERRDVRHLRVHGKVNKIRYVPLYRAIAGAIAAYLEVAGDGDDKVAPLFPRQGD